MEFEQEIDGYIKSHIIPEEDFLYELDRETNLSFVHPRMLSGHIQGKILYMLCTMISPRGYLSWEHLRIFCNKYGSCTWQRYPVAYD